MRAAVSVEAHTCLLRYHLTSKIKQATAAIGQRAITMRVGQGSKSQPSCTLYIILYKRGSVKGARANPPVRKASEARLKQPKLAAQATRPGGTGR